MGDRQEHSNRLIQTQFISGYMQMKPQTLWLRCSGCWVKRQLRKRVLTMFFCLKHLQLLLFSQQHYCGSAAEREQDSVGAFFLTQPLWKPHLSEPHQERYQLRGRRSLLITIQPAGEQSCHAPSNTWMHSLVYVPKSRRVQALCSGRC